MLIKFESVILYFKKSIIKKCKGVLVCFLFVCFLKFFCLVFQFVAVLMLYFITTLNKKSEDQSSIAAAKRLTKRKKTYLSHLGRPHG